MRRTSQQHDPNQLGLFDQPIEASQKWWEPPNTELPSPARSRQCDSSAETPPKPVSLNWDFRNTFPAPRPDAVDAGALGEFGGTHAELAGIHDEHARHALVLLSDIDAIADAERLGVDPATGRSPRTDAQKSRLQKTYRDEPPRLRQEFEGLIDVYENAFGEDAAKAFRIFVEASHKNIPVVAIEPATIEIASIPSDESRHPELPTPTPLPDAVAQGVFGIDENEDPVEPSPEEIATITRMHAEKMVEILHSIVDAEEALIAAAPSDRPSFIARIDSRRSAYLGLMRLYADDFGDTAASQLDSYARSVQREEAQESEPYPPSHPWYYLRRGDFQKPVPLADIPPAEAAGQFISEKWPRNPAKREAKIRQMLSDQAAQLKEDEARYQELIERGADALSVYDKTISSGGDVELALATAMSLKYNHVSNGRGRVNHLQNLLSPKSSRHTA